MIYREVNPEKNISIFIKSFWYFENDEDKMLQYEILPDGCFDLLIQYKSNGGKKINLTGLWRKNVEVTIPQDTKIFAIRFKPLATEYILGKNIVALLDSMTEITTVNYPFLKNINIDSLGFDSFVKSNTVSIQAIIDNGKEIDSRKAKVFDLLFRNNGDISIKSISEQAFWSNRQISEYFRKNLGLSPKSYANILRIHASYQDLAAGKLSSQTNFFDQSHFIKEIKKHTGTTPKQLKKNENDRFLQLSTKKRT